MRTTSPDLRRVALVVGVELRRAADRPSCSAGAPCTVSTLTTIVLSIAAETTTPRRSWRRPRSCSGFGSRVDRLALAGFARRLRRFGAASRRRFGFGAQPCGFAAAASAALARPRLRLSGSCGLRRRPRRRRLASGASSSRLLGRGRSAGASRGASARSPTRRLSVSSSGVFSSAISSLLSAAAACRSFRTVRMRAISRFASRSRAVFSSAPVADWKRRLNSSCRVSASRCSSSSSVRSRRCLSSQRAQPLSSRTSS